MLLVQVSDLHLDGGPRRRDRAARVMAYVNGLRGVDAVLVSGDIADHGEPAEYEQAREVLRSPHRVLTCPGNHDVREPYESVLLGRTPGGGAVNEAHDVNGVLVAMCDSSRPGRADGRLDETTLDWLDATLGGAADRPALVCFHHPPVPMHQPMIDAILLTEPEALATLLDRHPQVVAVLTGHAHTAAASTFAGRPCLVAPGVVSTLRLPAEHTGDLDYDLPPGVALHVLDVAQITTHYRVLP
jgi:3',5'-cyclic-AMP phosphodiesterase